MKVDKADCSMTCRTEEAGSSLRRTRRRVGVGHEGHVEQGQRR